MKQKRIRKIWCRALCATALLTTLLSAGCGETELAIYAITPTSGPASGGTQVTLTGEAFSEEMSVLIGNAKCESLEVVSDTEATCITPPHRVGTVNVMVSNMQEGEQLSSAFTYVCDNMGAAPHAFWANDGGDKVAKEELRAFCDANSVKNSLWDGSGISLFGAKNEVVGFNLVIEAGANALRDVEVRFSRLNGPGGSAITSVPTSGNGVFDWTQRDIELFYVRYLQIKGLSILAYNTYDERHIPQRLRRPWSGTGNGDSDGVGSGLWSDRPDHDLHYPDIAVPLEIEGKFDVTARTSQSIWTDIYIPKDAASGEYTGTISVLINGQQAKSIPVKLDVRRFTLPDVPHSKTMLFLGYEDIARRYVGDETPDDDPVLGPLADLVCDRHFQMAHRHKISMIDSNKGWTVWSQKRPRPVWEDRLDGDLFTASRGYAGPGEGVGNGVYSIGTYGSWSWKTDVDTRPDSELTTEQIAAREQAKQDMWTNTDAWESWFQQYAPDTERFLFLIDESPNYARTNLWAKWMDENPGVGRNLPSFATVPLDRSYAELPNLDIFASFVSIEFKDIWESLAGQIQASGARKLYAYNGFRPSSGTFMTEDDGVALRELAWGQYKKGISRWFYWQSTYYNDYQNSRGQTNVFQNAQTFGQVPYQDEELGLSGVNYANGDGVLFYPGTDMVYPNESYEIEGPIASLRLKHWRRGIQDVDYIVMAAQINPARVKEIVDTMVPKVLWENDSLPGNYIKTDISWSIDPDDWEAARAELADIIESGTP